MARNGKKFCRIANIPNETSFVSMQSQLQSNDQKTQIAIMCNSAIDSSAPKKEENTYTDKWNNFLNCMKTATSKHTHKCE